MDKLKDNVSSKIALNSCDHFQLLIDYKIRKEKGTGNTSQLLIELDGKVSLDELRRYLESNVHFVSLANSKLSRPIFGTETYILNKKGGVEVNELILEKLDFAEVFGNDDVAPNAVKTTLLQLGDKSKILFQFNHIFIDNNGVKNLLRSFNGEQYDFTRRKKDSQPSFFQRLKSTISLSRRMMSKWYESKAFIHTESKQEIDKGYIFHRFSKEETALIKGKVMSSHRVKSISSLLLAACCLSMKQLLDQRDEEPKELVFQQPFDLTPKREKPYILGNRFSFIHYRIPPKELTNLMDLQDEMNRQTIQQIREKTPHEFIDLQSVMRRLNLRLHLWMISLPARGKMTSFAYSYVDETKVIEEFAGLKIENIINIPPVMRRPPITIGAAYYDGQLLVQLHYDKNALDVEEAERFLTNMNSQLLA